MAAVPRTEPVALRLDEALAELQATAEGAEATQRVADLAEAWLGLDPVPGAAADASPIGHGGARGLDALVLDAAMPRLLDAGALRPERLLGLLEEIAASVPEDVDAAAAEPLAAVGAAMIEEELAKYRLLLGLQNALIEA